MVDRYRRDRWEVPPVNTPFAEALAGMQATPSDNRLGVDGDLDPKTSQTIYAPPTDAAITRLPTTDTVLITYWRLVDGKGVNEYEEFLRAEAPARVAALLEDDTIGEGSLRVWEQVQIDIVRTTTVKLGGGDV